MNNNDQQYICVVQKDASAGNLIHEHLIDNGFQSDLLGDAYTALRKLKNIKYNALICDVHLADMSGEKMLRTLINDNGGIPTTLLTTSLHTEEDAIKLLKLGVNDYFVRPLDLKQLTTRLHSLFHQTTSSTMSSPYCFLTSPAMCKIEKSIHALVEYPDTTVLLSGESGVGKEEIAKRLHESSIRNGPFIAVNCAAIPENLIEAELFGYVKGAFTGATKAHKGVFEQANGGTLLLDEIGDMPLQTQVKMLRVMQDYKIMRLGSEQNLKVNVRLICATNQELSKLVAIGRFRQDLYYRINVFNIHIPPLRERRQDIITLANCFLEQHTLMHLCSHKHFCDDAIEAMLGYPWPGNIRELKHTIERACIMSDKSMIDKSDLIFDNPLLPNKRSTDNLKGFLQDAEREKIIDILEENNWQISLSAECLGISRKALWEKMKKYNINKYHNQVDILDV